MDTVTPIKTCGIVIGAFKPYTKGHHFLITKASEENELVLVTVSQKDRIRKGEHPITWEKMLKVWVNFILPVLPKNVVLASNDNPIIAMYNFLHEIDQDKNRPYCVYNYYMDEKDKIRYCYSDIELIKKFPNLTNNNEIVIKTFDRGKNVNISATKMRKTLQNNDLQGFTECLPEILHPNAKEIFTLLS